VGGSVEANSIAERLAVTPWILQSGYYLQATAEASAEAAFPVPPRRAHDTLQPQGESIIVGFITLPQKCFSESCPVLHNLKSGGKLPMARGDGIHRTNARNMRLTAAKISNAQQHNEREKESYVNQDIIPERTQLNVHFKEPTGGYAEMFQKLKEDGVISTRGLKEDAFLYGELIFDVNTAYFHNHGGYDFAKQFYTDAYKAVIEIIGGEQYILSAVMHADERNRAMSDALGQDVYHYHLHVVYIPIVEKQILWTKRCKDKSLVGTVKETIQQVSMSKKWDSKLALDENGEPVLSTKGKPVLKKSYSVLQDDFFRYMRDAGYDDVERGERGSSEEHLTVTQFKVQQEQARLESIEDKIDKKKQTLEKYNEKIREQKGAAASLHEIDSIGKKTISGNISMTPQDAQFLKELAKEGVASRGLIGDLKNKVETLKRDVSVWKRKYEKLQEQTKDFMAALKRAPRKVKEFIQFMLHTEPEKPEQSRNRDMPRCKKCDIEL